MSPKDRNDRLTVLWLDWLVAWLAGWLVDFGMLRVFATSEA